MWQDTGLLVFIHGLGISFRFRGPQLSGHILLSEIAWPFALDRAVAGVMLVVWLLLSSTKWAILQSI